MAAKRREGRFLNSDSADETSLANIRRYINLLIVKVDHVMFTSRVVNTMASKGEVSCFKITYKIPKNEKGNYNLDKEVIANGDFSSIGNRDIDQISFRHKKVFPMELDVELIEKWEKAQIQFSLSMITSFPRAPKDKKGSRHLARAFISLSDLLVPPFRISRDCSLLGSELSGHVSLFIELGSRNVRIAEILSDMRKIELESTFTIRERGSGRRTRSRSSSRCRAHSAENENYHPYGETILIPKSPAARPSSSHSITDYSNFNSRVSRDYNSNDYHIQRRKISYGDSDNDSVFSISEQPARPPSRRGGALQLELTVYSARNLPMVQDKSGRWVCPMVYLQMLARDEQVMSTIAPASCNPVWNWTGRFVISSERGNLVVKILHKSGDQIGPLGMVTLTSPLQSFEETEFEISLFSPNATGAATINMSLIVKELDRTVSVSNLRASERYIPTRSSSVSRLKSNEEDIWRRSEDITSTFNYNPPRLPVSRPIFRREPRLSPETLRNKLRTDVDELMDVMTNLRCE